MCGFNELDKGLVASIYLAANSGVNDILFILREEKVVWANDRAVSLLGLSVEDMIGQYLFELIPVLRDVNIQDGEVFSFYYGDLFLEGRALKVAGSPDLIFIIRDISEMSIFRKKHFILDNIYALNEAISRLKINRI